MNRAGFLKRMAFAALASALFDRWVPSFEWRPEPQGWDGQWLHEGDTMNSGSARGTITKIEGGVITVTWSENSDPTKWAP